jgi:alpha-L-rhamnosidase
VRRFVGADGRLSSDSQTAYALAIVFELGDEPLWRERLVELVELNEFRIGTGFVGTPIICDALTIAGRPDVAWRLVLERECPSWLYPVSMGATTVWERWDSMLPDGSVNPGSMTSFNHYAFGAIADWLHRVAAGLAPAEPGYRRLEIRPRPGGGLTRACARLRTPYGIAESGWTVEDGALELAVVVPPNTTATVWIPGGEAVEVGSGSHRFTGSVSP